MDWTHTHNHSLTYTHTYRERVRERPPFHTILHSVGTYSQLVTNLPFFTK